MTVSEKRTNVTPQGQIQKFEILYSPKTSFKSFFRFFSPVNARTPQDMDGRLKGVFSKLETSRNMKK